MQQDKMFEVLKGVRTLEIPKQTDRSLKQVRYLFDNYIDNSTDLLQEDSVDEPILTENNTNFNDIDTYLNSSDVFMYYKGPERYGVYLYDFENNPLINKTINFTVNGNI